MIKWVHNSELKLYLLSKIILENFRFIYNFNSVDISREFVTDFINLTKASNSYIRVRERLKILFFALSLFSWCYTWWEEKDSIFDWIDFFA